MRGCLNIPGRDNKKYRKKIKADDVGLYDIKTRAKILKGSLNEFTTRGGLN